MDPAVLGGLKVGPFEWVGGLRKKVPGDARKGGLREWENRLLLNLLKGLAEPGECLGEHQRRKRGDFPGNLWKL